MWRVECHKVVRERKNFLLKVDRMSTERRGSERENTKKANPKR
jgi:hypothetical protein